MADQELSLVNNVRAAFGATKSLPMKLDGRKT
jgi:hypothetical protein